MKSTPALRAALIISRLIGLSSIGGRWSMISTIREWFAATVSCEANPGRIDFRPPEYPAK